MVENEKEWNQKKEEIFKLELRKLKKKTEKLKKKRNGK